MIIGQRSGEKRFVLATSGKCLHQHFVIAERCESTGRIHIVELPGEHLRILSADAEGNPRATVSQDGIKNLRPNGGELLASENDRNMVFSCFGDHRSQCISSDRTEFIHIDRVRCVNPISYSDGAGFRCFH